MGSWSLAPTRAKATGKSPNGSVATSKVRWPRWISSLHSVPRATLPSPLAVGRPGRPGGPSQRGSRRQSPRRDRAGNRGPALGQAFRHACGRRAAGRGPPREPGCCIRQAGSLPSIRAEGLATRHRAWYSPTVISRMRISKGAVADGAGVRTLGQPAGHSAGTGRLSGRSKSGTTRHTQVNGIHACVLSGLES